MGLLDKNLFNQLIELGIQLFSQKIEENSKNQPVISPNNDPKKVSEIKQIDWNDPKAHITDKFSVKDALLLPSWGAFHVPSEEEKNNIIEAAKRVTALIKKLEIQLGKTLIPVVHVWIRPKKANIPGTKLDGVDYNRYIYETYAWAKLTPEERAKKKVPESPHIEGKAIDFHFVGHEGAEKCAEMRQLIVPLLEEFNLRCENLSGSWIHNDINPVINSRFFKP